MGLGTMTHLEEESLENLFPMSFTEYCEICFSKNGEWLMTTQVFTTGIDFLSLWVLDLLKHRNRNKIGINKKKLPLLLIKQV